MLEAETKRRIDTARDILVGKVPDPKSQVEQITIALIYKFMDDMDKESISMGGNPSFFVGEYEKYSWTRIFNPRLGGYEMLSLYSEAITRLSQNPNLPSLFRDIFKNAYLPYRDPETLKLFLKTINEFVYDHSERLGDAYEYLLAVLGSQGDAGQFLTPRHIINFMVQVVDPKKDEVILDPACGTAGFLISAYRHILQANTDKTPGDLFTIDERKRLVNNIKGYDIAPDMVRLSLVNMYLHGFTNPQISEYDTLTSEDKWGEYADVILANPPFMTPKGGIKPHQRFSVQSNRSEVLFVDYIAEHLIPNGRAAVIVPEGVIFQSGKAYKQLRKELVEKYLWAVVSLPAGVFNPYSGVKTSILFMDKQLAKKSDSILFIKINNDGYGLGAQRKEIDKNDLPEAMSELMQFSQAVSSGGIGVSLMGISSLGSLLVKKDILAKGGEYNLLADRYAPRIMAGSHRWPQVRICEVAKIEKGTAITQKETSLGAFPVIAGGKTPAYYHNEYNRSNKTITVSASGAYAGYINYFESPIFASDCTTIQSVDEDIYDTKLLYYILKTKQNDFYKMQRGGGQPHVYASDFRDYLIPLPPLEVQREIVAEIEEYQKIIDGARQIVDNWKPRIDVDPEWPLVELGNDKLFEIIGGTTPDSQNAEYWNGSIPWATLADLPQGDHITMLDSTKRTISEEGLRNSSLRMLPPKSVVVSTRATIGRVGISAAPLTINQGLKGFIIKDNLRINELWLALMLKDKKAIMESLSSGGTFKEISKSVMTSIAIPVPDINTQKRLIEVFTNEQNWVNSCTRLIELYTNKTTKRICSLQEGA